MESVSTSLQSLHLGVEQFSRNLICCRSCTAYFAFTILESYKFYPSLYIGAYNLLFDNMDDDKRKEDRLVQDYDTVLRKNALLTAFAGILFGFLLEISINAAKNELEYDDRIALVIALFSITHSNISLRNACDLSSYTISL